MFHITTLIVVKQALREWNRKCVEDWLGTQSNGGKQRERERKSVRRSVFGTVVCLERTSSLSLSLSCTCFTWARPFEQMILLFVSPSVPHTPFFFFVSALSRSKLWWQELNKKKSLSASDNKFPLYPPRRLLLRFWRESAEGKKVMPSLSLFSSRCTHLKTQPKDAYLVVSLCRRKVCVARCLRESVCERGRGEADV